MKSLKKIILMVMLTLLLSISLIPLKAQQEGSSAVPSVEMADTFRQEGKIYVVVAVILLIFGGIVAYTIAIDRKVSRLEKELGMQD